MTFRPIPRPSFSSRRAHPASGSRGRFGAPAAHGGYESGRADGVGRETSTSESGGYSSLLTAELRTDRGVSSVAGTLFHREPRFVAIDGFALEAVPHGFMLVFANQDVPGVVGRIGTLCGRHGINIAGMQLGRERRGGRAVSILNLDDAMPPAALEEIRAMPDIVSARLVQLA